MNEFQQLRFQHTKTGAVPQVMIHLKRGEDIKHPGSNCLGINHIRPHDHQIALPQFVQVIEQTICARCVVLADAVSFGASSLII